MKSKIVEEEMIAPHTLVEMRMISGGVAAAFPQIGTDLAATYP